MHAPRHALTTSALAPIELINEATAIVSQRLPNLDANEDQLAELERKIASRTAGRIRDLRVEAVDDLVILSGRTNTYYVKQLASQIALDDAPFELQNAIEVV